MLVSSSAGAQTCKGDGVPVFRYGQSIREAGISMAIGAGSSDVQEASDGSSDLPAPDVRDFKSVMARINRSGWKALSNLSTELDRPLQRMIVEALNDYLVKHGRSPEVEGRAVPKN